MTEENQPVISIQGQIYERMISNLQKRDGFSPEIIRALQELAERGELSKDKQISKALKLNPEGNNETH
jgi:hypothetical protein